MDQGVDDDLSDIAEESVDSAASDEEEVSSEDGRRGRGRAVTKQSKKPAARRTAAPKAKAAVAPKKGGRSSKQVVADDEDSIDGVSAVGLQSASKSSMLQPTNKRSNATTSSRSAASRHVEAVDDIVDDEGFVMTAGTSKYTSTTQRSIRLPALELDSQQQQSSQPTKKRQLPVSFSQSLNSQHTKKQATASVIDLVSGWDD